MGVVIATALGAVLVATSRLVTNQSLRRGFEDLAVARSAFSRLMAARADATAVQVRLITTQPIFRARLADRPDTEDLAILRTMADEYPRQLQASFSIVTDRHATWLAAPGWPAGGLPPSSLQSAIRTAVGGQPQSAIVPIQGGLFLVVAEPARFAEETLGAMIAGFALDDSVARTLAEITHCEVTLVAGEQLAGSSLPGGSRSQLVRQLELIIRRSEQGPVLQQLGAMKYVGGTFPLTSESADVPAGRLVLLRDWTPTQQVLDQLTSECIVAGVIVFVCALTGGVLFSRRVSRPFQDVAAAARDIAHGSWSRQVSLRGSAEAMTMAAAFNQMSVRLRHWYDEAQAKSAHLEASYARFSSVTESARDAIVSTDEKAAITFWNRAAIVTFGYDEATALGMPLTDLIALPDRLRCFEAFMSLARAASDAAPTGVVQLMGLHRDGRTFPIELSLSARRSDGPPQVIAVVRDITERKLAQETLEQRDLQLQHAQKMEAIGRLAGGVAHDFNNLLTAIVGFSGLVKETLEPNDPRRFDMDEVLNAADHATALTRQLLAFSRRQVVSTEVVALDEIVRTTEKMLRRVIGEDITLSSIFRSGPTFVRADPGQIEQVLMNLCVNARDAMPDGGELRIELSSIEFDAASVVDRPGVEPGCYVRLSVSDTGVGIASDVIDHIFEPFFTTKETGKGTGLGLSTVYGIARQNGGHIEVETQPGRGSAFHVYFPCVDIAEDVPAEDVRSLASEQGTETILLVEDERRVRDLVSTVLRRCGYTVLEACRGEEALEVARNHVAPIHLLLSDVVMPGIGGRMVAARVTELRPGTRILLMSGYSDDVTLRTGIEAAQTPFIQKPFTATDLALKVREVLSGPASS
jgi:PAS domain S-box-containing protein